MLVTKQYCLPTVYDFHCMDKKQTLLHFSKYLILYSTEERKS